MIGYIILYWFACFVIMTSIIMSQDNKPATERSKEIFGAALVSWFMLPALVLQILYILLKRLIND